MTEWHDSAWFIHLDSIKELCPNEMKALIDYAGEIYPENAEDSFWDIIDYLRGMEDSVPVDNRSAVIKLWEALQTEFFNQTGLKITAVLLDDSVDINDPEPAKLFTVDGVWQFTIPGQNAVDKGLIKYLAFSGFG